MRGRFFAAIASALGAVLPVRRAARQTTQHTAPSIPAAPQMHSVLPDKPRKVRVRTGLFGLRRRFVVPGSVFVDGWTYALTPDGRVWLLNADGSRFAPVYSPKICKRVRRARRRA